MVYSSCRFQEVLLLDCDVVLMRDPAYLFDTPGFKAQGNYFWSDIYNEGMFQDKAFGYVGKCGVTTQKDGMI